MQRNGSERRRKIVSREGHVLAVEIDLEHAVDRFADAGELVERGAEQLLLHHAVDDRDQDDKAGMQRLRCVKLPKVARVVLVTRTKSPSRA